MFKFYYIYLYFITIVEFVWQNINNIIIRLEFDSVNM